MLNYQNPRHEGNSAQYHTGKACIEKGCSNPAGTFWSPLWCFDHNVKRMTRITVNLDDAVRRAEVADLVDKQVASIRSWAYESQKTIRAMVLAAGGELTIKNSDRDIEGSSESVSYGKETTTYRYYAPHPRSLNKERS